MPEYIIINFCALVYSVKYINNCIKKQNTPIYSNINYREEMKFVPMIMDYCLLQFDASKFSVGVHLHGRFLPILLCFQCKFLQISQRNPKIVCIQVFKTFLSFVWAILGKGILTNAIFLIRKPFLLNISGVDEESIHFIRTTNN